MNIWAEGIDMEKIRAIAKAKNKSEDSSLDKSQEELQDTTANGRSENVKAVRVDAKNKGLE